MSILFIQSQLFIRELCPFITFIHVHVLRNNTRVLIIKPFSLKLIEQDPTEIFLNFVKLIRQAPQKLQQNVLYKSNVRMFTI